MALIVPDVASPPLVPFTFQVTAWFGVPVTLAKKNCVPPALTVA